MSSEMSFWRLLETRPSRAAVMAKWRTVAGDLLPAIRPLLRPIDRPATAYPNPRLNGLPMKVVQHADDTIVAIDEQDWKHRLDLTSKDIVLHQLDLRKLRTALCELLSCVNIAKTPVDQATPCLQIGNWEPQKAASFPVYLLLCRHRGLLHQEVLDLMARCKRPGAILLTPTRINWDGDLDDLTRNRKMLLVAISEVVEPADGGFQESPAWEEYLQAFCQMVNMTLPSNYRNKRPNARRASLMAKVEKAKRALVDHIRSARDGVVASIDAGDGARLVRFLTKSDLAKLADLKPYHVTRCFEADPQLDRLYQIANDPEELLRFGK